jgi:predicted DNA-binding transcriptional regulator AlpA
MAEDRRPLGTPAEIAEFLSKPEKTLAEWRSRRIGPRYFKLAGGSVRYRWADVEEWLKQQAAPLRA